MAKEAFKRTKPHVNIGTIGHVDHGKTTLTAAITKVLAEKGGGVNIRLLLPLIMRLKKKHVGLPLTHPTWNMKQKIRHYAHVDCPGHADYVKNMITGAAQMDGAILVVAATDGAMPQTKEHILLGSPDASANYCRFLKQMDMLAEGDQELLDLVELELHELLEAKEYKDCTIIRGSALKALEGDPKSVEAILELMKTVDEKIKTPQRDVDKPFLMPIEDVFSISGRGTVATGRVERGVVKINDKLDIVGFIETRRYGCYRPGNVQ